nr:hypothetical protein [Bradyrhizobium sp. 188]
MAEPSHGSLARKVAKPLAQHLALVVRCALLDALPRGRQAQQLRAMLLGRAF